MAKGGGPNGELPFEFLENNSRFTKMTSDKGPDITPSYPLAPRLDAGC